METEFTQNIDPAWEYYKKVTSSKFVKSFENTCLSGLTKNELLYGGGIKNSVDRKHYNSEEIIKYIVAGKIYDAKVNSMFKFEYQFDLLDNAEKYFELIMLEYPSSKIKITKKTWQEIRGYC